MTDHASPEQPVDPAQESDPTQRVDSEGSLGALDDDGLDAVSGGGQPLWSRIFDGR